MKHLNHENVIKFFTDFKDEEGNIYIIMEYMDGGNLCEFISFYNELNIPIEEEKLWNIFAEFIKGLVYLHEKGLIHRNIKPANLLLNSRGEIKYSDFSVSAIVNYEKAKEFADKKINVEDLINDMVEVGSGKFAAPEIESDDYLEYDLEVDVYSLGITFCV